MAVSAIYVGAEIKRNNLTIKPSSITECSLNESFAYIFTKCRDFEEELIVTKARALILFLFSYKRKWYETSKNYICADIFFCKHILNNQNSGDLSTLGGNMWSGQSKGPLTYCSKSWSYEDLVAV